MKKIKLSKIIMPLIGITIIGWAFYKGNTLFDDKNKFETSDDAQIEQYISPINVRVPGYIQKIYFTEHQHVKKGDTLLVLDQREYKLQLRIAQANLKEALTGGDILEASIDRSQQSAQTIDNSIEELKIRIEQLELDEQRYKNLVENKAATPIQLEHIQVELKSVRQKLDSAIKTKQAANTGVTEVKRKSGNIEASKEKAETAIEHAKLNLSYTVVIAPCDGQIGRRAIEEGQFIPAGTVITNIIPDREKWIIANFKETQIKNIHIGQKVSITIDAIENKVFEGHVTEIAGATGNKFSNIPTDNSAGNFVKIQQRIPVRIVFDNISLDDYNKMATGMMAIVKVKISHE